jgi:hypothetical protein
LISPKIPHFWIDTTSPPKAGLVFHRHQAHGQPLFELLDLCQIFLAGLPA